MNKRTLLVLLSILLFVEHTYAQTTQKGVTLEYHGKEKKTTLGNVQIVANGASTISSTNGEFSLFFQTLKKGDKINVNRIAKSGYVIFNKDALDQWIVSSSNNVFKVVLCKVEDFDNLVNTYYGVSMKQYEKQLNLERNKWKRLEKEGRIKEQELLTKLAEAEESYQRSLNALQNLAEMMARIDESEIDSLSQKALELTAHGQIEKAAEIIKERNLSDLLEKVVAKEKLGRKVVEDAMADKKKLIKEIKTEILILQSHGGIDNFNRCADLYKQIAGADSLDYENSISCANFLYKQNRYDEANRYYLTAIDTYSSTNKEISSLYYYNLARIKANYANSLCDGLQTEKAEDLYKCMISEVSQHCDTTQIGSLDLLVVLNNSLASLYTGTRNYDEALQYCECAYEIENKLIAQDSLRSKNNMINVLNNMFVIFSMQKNYDEALKYIEQCITMIREVGNLTSEVKSFKLGTAYGNMALTLYKMQRNEDSEDYYKKAIQIKDELSKKNPQSYTPSLLGTYVNYGSLLTEMHEYQRADSIFSLVQVISNKYLDENPILYRPKLANALNNRATVCLEMMDYSRAKSIMFKAIEQKKMLLELSPRVYVNTYLASRLTLSKIYVCLNKLGKGLEECDEILLYLNTMDYLPKSSKDQIIAQVQVYKVFYLLLMENRTDAETLYNHLLKDAELSKAIKNTMKKVISEFEERGVITKNWISDVQSFCESMTK